MKKYLLTGAPLPASAYGWIALALRLFVGAMMLTHALPKIINYPALSLTFADPLGLGSQMSLILVILAEGFCSLLLIAGAFTRPAALVLTFNMFVAAFIASAGAPLAQRELAVMYLAMYLLVALIGPGRFSVDRYLFRESYPHE